MILITAVFILCMPQVDGLGRDERAIELSPVVVAEEHVRRGRIVDAFTGRPVPGAVVEAWTEEITEETSGFQQVGAGRTGADGCFALPVSLDGHMGEKLRVRAPGYLAYSGTLGDVFDDIVLFPRSARPPRLRIVDTGGRPIPGARITTTYSCAHDVPAFDLRTDANGEAECEELGLQRRIQELRVRAAGFGAIKYLSPDDHLLGDRRAPLVVPLARRRPARLRLLDRSGDPMAHRMFHILDGDGYHAVRSDARGMVTLRSRYGHGRLVVQTLDPGSDDHVGEVRPLGDRVVALCPRPDEWPGDLPTGLVRVRSANDAKAPMVLRHADGWAVDVEPGTTRRFPAGQVCLVVGGAFSGFEEQVRDFHLVESETQLLLAEPVAEPRISVIASDGRAGRVLIEAGDRSIELEGPGRSVSVPRVESVVLIQEGAPPRRIEAEVGPGVVEIDLAAAAPFGTSPALPDERGEIGLEFRGDAGGVVTGALGVVVSHPLCTVTPTGESGAGWTVDGPVGAPFLVRFEAPDHRPVWLRGRVGAEPGVLNATAIRRAAVVIEAPFEFEVPGFDAARLADLAPGPLGLIVQAADGRRWGLSLRLEPGTRRKLVFRD